MNTWQMSWQYSDPDDETRRLLTSRLAASACSWILDKESVAKCVWKVCTASRRHVKSRSPQTKLFLRYLSNSQLVHVGDRRETVAIQTNETFCKPIVIAVLGKLVTKGKAWGRGQGKGCDQGIPEIPGSFPDMISSDISGS